MSLPASISDTRKKIDGISDKVDCALEMLQAFRNSAAVTDAFKTVEDGATEQD